MKKLAYYFKNKDFLISFLSAIGLLAGSLVVNFYAGLYATEKASNAVTDIILNNIPLFDVDGIFIYGALALWIFITVIIVIEPKRIPFTVKSVGLFILIRSLFITLTHLGPFPTHVVIPALNILDKITFGGDLFFSGHTGLPFLMALIFWDSIWLRCVFLCSSLLFGTVVLMGHLHYSIDVLGAYFITYSIFRLCEMFFKKDRALFEGNLGIT